jgi:hypothetical protein
MPSSSPIYVNSTRISNFIWHQFTWVLASPPTYPTKPSTFDSFEFFLFKGHGVLGIKKFCVGKGKGKGKAQGHFVWANTCQFWFFWIFLFKGCGVVGIKKFSLGKGKARGHFVWANTWETREEAQILCAWKQTNAGRPYPLAMSKLT